MRPSRVVRDNDDTQKLLQWLLQHPPFPELSELMSISTGVVGDENINCHMSREIGATLLSKVHGNYFHDIKLKRKEKVLPLSAINMGIKIHDELVPIDPLLIFQRLCVTKQSDKDLQ